MINNFGQAEGFWLTKGDKVRLKKDLRKNLKQ